MPASEASIPTSSGSRYLVQLCKHWSHKFAVEYSAHHGKVPFGPDRTCTFKAASDHLMLRVEAPDPEALTRLEGIVIEHLRRFAFREDLGEVKWTNAA